MTALIRYEQARSALAECARIDEASEIRDKAAALAAYARQRDDRDLEVWVREIHLRACVRIGELSRDIEAAERRRGEHGRLLPTDGNQVTKAQALAEAGLSTTAAARYEEVAGVSATVAAMAGDRAGQAEAAGKAAMEAYFAQSRAERAPPTMAGLRGAVRGALQATLGPLPTRAKRPPSPPEQPKVAPIGADWVDWTGAVQDLARLDCDLPELAARSAALMPTLLREALQAAERLRIWINLLEPTNDQAH
jgi:hypothetical protein